MKAGVHICTGNLVDVVVIEDRIELFDREQKVWIPLKNPQALAEELQKAIDKYEIKASV